MAAVVGSKNALQVLASAGKVCHWSLSAALSLMKAQRWPMMSCAVTFGAIIEELIARK